MSESQKLLITGRTGFFGRNLIEVLRKSEFNYVGVSTSDGDLREWSSWKRLFEMHRPSSVIHLAAKSGGIKSNLNNPYNFFYDNLAMLTNLTRALNEYELEQVVVPIGGCSYPALAQGPISEEELWRGFPHSASAPFSTVKLLSTLLPQVFQNRRINIIVPGNMYGPFDNFSLEDSHVIPGMIRKIHIAKVEKKNEVFFLGVRSSRAGLCFRTRRLRSDGKSYNRFRLSNSCKSLNRHRYKFETFSCTPL